LLKKAVTQNTSAAFFITRNEDEKGQFIS